MRLKSLFGTAVLFLLTVCLYGQKPTDGTHRSSHEPNWGGRAWTAAETALYQGRPVTAHSGTDPNFITVAYDRFVSHYDLARRAPVWVAYVTDRASALVSEDRSRASFERPAGFFREPLIIAASRSLRLRPAADADYGDSVAPGLTGNNRVPRDITATEAKKYPGYIQRGHLAPNNAMKCWGTPEQGRKSQDESFSLANVVAQMNNHNAPTWSALEDQCLRWAKELGTVAVIAGPIYKNPERPRTILDRETNSAKEIVFPDSLFCVVIAYRDGKLSAAGFIMPHQVSTYDWRGKAVPIDRIEALTGINFMPARGEPNPLETTVDERWRR